jgi:REP element-mobilizing transposase RayT
MMISDDTVAWRRRLPHLQRRDRTYFLTFCTQERRELTPIARDIAMSCVLHDNGGIHYLIEVVVMPDHVHVLFQPFDFSLDTILTRIKSVSSRLINQLLVRKGRLWQEGYFDRILRRSEDVQKKCEYVAANPVRAGLVQSPDEYRWLWRWWNEQDRERWNEDSVRAILSGARATSPALDPDKSQKAGEVARPPPQCVCA